MRRIAWISCVLLGLTSGTDAEADVISLEDLFFEGPARENVEFLVGSAFPGGLRNGQGYGAPPAGFQFPESGMILRAPDPNDPGGTGLLIGDFRDAPLIYGLGTNGVIDDPTDVLPLFAIPPAPAGEGFAASGSDEAGEILFEFPRAVSSFGIYTSTHDAEPLTIRSYDAFGGLIEEPFVLEDSEPAPLRNENFIGLTFPGSSIASFSVEGGDYVFD